MLVLLFLGVGGGGGGIFMYIFVVTQLASQKHLCAKPTQSFLQ